MSSFRVRSSTIRLGIFISTLIIATILVFQLAWLRKVYFYEEKEFDHGVFKAIRGMYEDMDISAYNSAHIGELVEKGEKQHYLARISLPISEDSLVNYLQYELEDFDIFTRCRVSIYSAAAGKYIYSNLLESAGSKRKNDQPPVVFKRNYDYVALYFPNRGKYILSQMNVWIISSAILLLVLVLFGASLYYFYRQKFLNETQKDFIHNFTHEFKTPVTVISLAADVLKDETIAAKPEKLATYAGIVGYQANYLRGQTDKLLQFAYAESGRLHLRKEATDIHQLVNEAITNLVPLISERGARLQYGLDASNPVIQADRDYILIVITNLLDNAIKYSRDPEVTIATMNTRHCLRLTVKDNGVGLEPGQLKKVFRKFYRAGSGEEYRSKGFGLGLAFVKTILDAHKGKISVKSEKGRGSIFIIDLPYK